MKIKLLLTAAVLSVTANSASIDSIGLDLGSARSFGSPLSTNVARMPSELAVPLAPLSLLAAKEAGAEKVISIKGQSYSASIASRAGVDVVDVLASLPRRSMGRSCSTITFVNAILDEAAGNYKIIKDGVTITLNPTL